MRQGRQGKRTDKDVREAIEHFALDGERTQRIAELLAEDEQLGPRAPGIRTIQAIATAARRGDGSGPWSSLDAPADELRAVLPVLAWVVERTARRSVTVTEAGIITRLAAYAPELSESARFWIARGLAGDAAGADYFLAFTPWLDGGLRYARAFRSGRIDTFHSYLGSGVTPEAVDIATGGSDDNA